MAPVTKLLTPRGVEPAHARTRRGIDTPWVAWVGAIGLTLLTFALRWWRLGQPHTFAFDETYYAKHAWSLLHHGYARRYVDDANEKILAGDLEGLWTDAPEMVTHPEVGKWLIALGEWGFGMDPTGWRVASAVVGALMVLVMCRLATRLTGSVLLGWTAGLLLSLDGMHFVMSRLALIDIFLAFFLLCAVHCVVADRQWFTRRLAAHEPVAADAAGRAAWGPLVWWRPWLLAGGVAFGLATGTKWAGLYALAVFGLWVWLSSASVRHAVGVRWAVLRSALVDGGPAFAYLVLVGFFVYVVSWTGWLVNSETYEEHFSHTQYTTEATGEQWPSAAEPDAEGFGEVTQSLRSLVSYHRDVYAFHTKFLNDTTHSAASHPKTWLLMQHPIAVHNETGIEPGTEGCDADAGSSCLRIALLLGNPVLWWGGCLALVASLVLWIGRLDWRFGIPVLGVAATWVPWFQYADRTVFIFYTVAILPFVVLALTLGMGALLGPRPETSTRRTLAAIACGSFVAAALVAFYFFWPIWSGELITNAQWQQRMWLNSWL